MVKVFVKSPKYNFSTNLYIHFVELPRDLSPTTLWKVRLYGRFSWKTSNKILEIWRTEFRVVLSKVTDDKQSGSGFPGHIILKQGVIPWWSNCEGWIPHKLERRLTVYITSRITRLNIQTIWNTSLTGLWPSECPIMKHVWFNFVLNTWEKLDKEYIHFDDLKHVSWIYNYMI